MYQLISSFLILPSIIYRLLLIVWYNVNKVGIINMHITDIKKFLCCPRLYQFIQNEKHDYFSYFNINADVTGSVAKKLKLEHYALGEVGQSNEDTLKLAQENNWIFRARFVYNELRIKIPLINIKEENHCDLYFTVLATYAQEDTLGHYIATKVLKHCGFTVDNIYLLYLDCNYVREENLDDEKLWVLTEYYNHARDGKTIIECVRDFDFDLDEVLAQIANIDNELCYSRSSKCSGRKRCEYYDQCFPEEMIEEDNSILTLVSSQHKGKMYANGIRYLRDAEPALIEGNRIQYAQIMADKNGGLFFEKEALRCWMDKNVQLPISFIDFEWDLFPIPPYHGMKPLDVLPFQYSLHVFDGKDLKHYQFIGLNDSREKLIKSMIENVPETGTVCAYNATGAERIRINEFIATFPQYAEPLKSINRRMVDFAIPFINGLVYDVRMRGAFTLKVIENMLDKEHSYKDLECGDGMAAVDIYRKLSASDDEKMKETYFNQLYAYCGLDTYSLYRVYLWLNKLLTE